ncbi:hypothetical protein MMC07_000381 [Pseudocyphellaria aurata]|nr:hypothetical protein [Pseudocyphellaria aurata]
MAVPDCGARTAAHMVNMTPLQMAMLALKPGVVQALISSAFAAVVQAQHKKAVISLHAGFNGGLLGCRPSCSLSTTRSSPSGKSLVFTCLQMCYATKCTGAALPAAYPTLNGLQSELCIQIYCTHLVQVRWFVGAVDTVDAMQAAKVLDVLAAANYCRQHNTDAKKPDFEVWLAAILYVCENKVWQLGSRLIQAHLSKVHGQGLVWSVMLAVCAIMIHSEHYSVQCTRGFDNSLAFLKEQFKQQNLENLWLATFNAARPAGWQIPTPLWDAIKHNKLDYCRFASHASMMTVQCPASAILISRVTIFTCMTCICLNIAELAYPGDSMFVLLHHSRMSHAEHAWQQHADLQDIPSGMLHLSRPISTNCCSTCAISIHMHHYQGACMVEQPYSGMTLRAASLLPARALVKHGCEPWLPALTGCLEGVLPITFALQQGHLHIASYLLDMAHPGIKYGPTVVLRTHSHQVLDAFFSSPARPALPELSDWLKRLGEHELDAEQPGLGRDPLQRTPVMLACQHGYAAAVEALTGPCLEKSVQQVTCFACAALYLLTGPTVPL